ncbi:MAG: hypothetical protein AABY53_10485 [Bdellovibrionota bacterium]
MKKFLVALLALSLSHLNAFAVEMAPATTEDSKRFESGAERHEQEKKEREAKREERKAERKAEHEKRKEERRAKREERKNESEAQREERKA